MGPFEPSASEESDVEMQEASPLEPLKATEPIEIQPEEVPEGPEEETDAKPKKPKIRIRERNKDSRRILHGATGIVKKIQTGLYVEFYDTETNRSEFAFSRYLTEKLANI